MAGCRSVSVSFDIVNQIDQKWLRREYYVGLSRGCYIQIGPPLHYRHACGLRCRSQTSACSLQDMRELGMTRKRMQSEPGEKRGSGFRSGRRSDRGRLRPHLEITLIVFPESCFSIVIVYTGSTALGPRTGHTRHVQHLGIPVGESAESVGGCQPRTEGRQHST